jgi:hypothetical protein
MVIITAFQVRPLFRFCPLGRIYADGGLRAQSLNIGQENFRIKMSHHPAHKPLEFSRFFRLILLIPVKG